MGEYSVVSRQWSVVGSQSSVVSLQSSRRVCLCQDTKFERCVSSSKSVQMLFNSGMGVSQAKARRPRDERRSWGGVYSIDGSKGKVREVIQEAHIPEARIPVT